MLNKVTLELHIVPSQVNLSLIDGCDPESIGKKYSDKNQVMVNKVGSDNYTVLYTSSMFEELDMPILGRNIINILMKNLKNSEISISIFYHYEFIDNDDDDKFSMETAIKIIELHVYFSKMFNDRTAVINCNVIKYITSESVIETAEYIRDIDSSSDDEDIDGIEAYLGGYDQETDEDDEDDVVTTLSEILSDSSYGKKSNKKYNTKKKDYGSSRVFRAAKSPKRAYHRHGVVVCSKKSAIKKDEKIIKEFLKDFLPGNAEWKKEFRRDVLRRWMSMYVVSSNKLKQLEKEHQKQMKKKRYKSIDANKAIDLTRRLLNVPIDTWSDPSK